MNKTQLVDALAARLGDRRSAADAVDGLLDTIVEAVAAGESVSITGFGVFESRARAARTARNPRTGEPVAVAAATVPAFRPGAAFRSAVGDTTPAPASPGAAPRRRSPARSTPATPGSATSTTGRSRRSARFADAESPLAGPAGPTGASGDEVVRAGGKDTDGKDTKGKDTKGKKVKGKDGGGKDGGGKDKKGKDGKGKKGK